MSWRFQLDQKTADKLREKIKEFASQPDFVIGHALIPPANKMESIKKRLCTKIIQFHLNNKHIKRSELAEMLEINPSTLSFILNYHLDKFSIDTLVKCLEILSAEDISINDTLKRMAIA